MTLDRRLKALEAQLTATPATTPDVRWPIYRIEGTTGVAAEEGQDRDEPPSAEQLRARLRRLVTLHATRPESLPPVQWYSADETTGRRLWHVLCPPVGPGDRGAEFIIAASDDPCDIYTANAPADTSEGSARP